jgi:inhibitor of KinA sporulation pathway (predicted exonuclease)
MENRLDSILVIDIESTCWAGEPPPGQQSEIIEVGICLLDVATLQRTGQASLIVRPELSSVSERCTELTTLTQADVDAGISLREACHILREEYYSSERLWASYGDYDRKKFQRECRAKRVAYPFGHPHLNVKNLLAVVHQLPREVELDQAFNLLGWLLEGTYHRGDADAWNIARLLGHMLARARGAG